MRIYLIIRYRLYGIVTLINLYEHALNCTICLFFEN